MISSQSVVEADSNGTINWAVGVHPDILARIHEKDVNIAIYERNIDALADEVKSLLDQQVACRASGTIAEIEEAMKQAIGAEQHGLVISDIKQLLHHFQEVAGTEKFRLLLATINTNMCRKFHTDINDVRLLCTYTGPGTLWLTDGNINRKARGDDSIAIM